MNTSHYPDDFAMDEDENMDEDSISINSTQSDIEWQLENLNTFNNEKQLDILKKEICHIMIHRAYPSEGWYDERYRIILEYSKLNWNELAKRFQSKDEYIHNTAHTIHIIIDELMEERGTRPNFTIRTYHQMIMSVHCLWHYYNQVYVDNDTDITDLIEGMKFL
jgi:hypothetical protein